jgi:transcriptional regulator with XRE-family HTH domain
MIVSLDAPAEIIKNMACLMRRQRLDANMTQQELAKRANVSLAVLRKFERSGKISLGSFIKLAFVLGLTDDILTVLEPKPQPVSSIDDLLAEDPRGKRQRASPRKEA